MSDLVPSDPDGLAATRRPATSAEVEAAATSGVALPPGVAEAVRNVAGAGSAKKALGRLAGRREPWVVVLDPSNDVRRQIESGKLVLTKTTRGGRLLAQARDPKTGRIAENIKLKEAATASKSATAAKAATAGAGMAWQAMAIATQQHYLVEISGKLSDIQQGVSELIDRGLDDKAAKLKATRRELDLINRHLDDGVELDSNDRQTVRDRHSAAERIYDAAATRVRKILDDPSRDPAEALSDLVLADQAAAVSARCSSTLLRMPYASETKRLNEFWHYADLTDEAIHTVNALVARLDDELGTALSEWSRYRAERPAARRKKAWNATGGHAVRHIGPKKPRFDGLERLPDSHAAWIRGRAALAKAGPEATSATVVLTEQGAVLLTERTDGTDD